MQHRKAAGAGGGGERGGLGNEQTITHMRATVVGARNGSKPLLTSGIPAPYKRKMELVFAVCANTA